MAFTRVLSANGPTREEAMYAAAEKRRLSHERILEWKRKHKTAVKAHDWKAVIALGPMYP